MSWQNRVNDSIYLKSPSGLPFRAYWKGNARSMDKKVGIFEYPKARGVVAQDLDVGGVKYPLNIFFEGPDHDIYAAQFFEACKERGPWEVLHPVRGNLTLQLLTVSEGIEPVSSGNVTEFELDWIEVGIDNPAASVAEIEEEVYEALSQIQADTANQFDDAVQVDKPSFLAKLKAGVAKAVAISDKVKAGIAGVMSEVTAVRATVLGIVNSAAMSTISLASAITTLILLPGQIVNDLKTRINYYNEMLERVFTDFDKDFQTVYLGGTCSVNTAAIVELVSVTSLVGMAQAIVETEFKSRKEALHYLEQMESAVMRVTDGLDAIQDAYAGQYIDKQYFSQSSTFNSMMELVRRVRELILRRSFDLAASKVITLQRDRAPIEIAMTEGVDFDIFIETNELSGNDILLLPVGRQVVVYL